MSEAKPILSIADFLNHIDTALRANLNNRSEWSSEPERNAINDGWNVELRIFLGSGHSYLAWIYHDTDESSGKWSAFVDGQQDNRITGLLNGWKRDESGVMLPEKVGAV